MFKRRHSFSFRPRNVGFRRKNPFLDTVFCGALSLLVVYTARIGWWTPPPPPAFAVRLAAEVLSIRLRGDEFLSDALDALRRFGDVDHTRSDLVDARRAATDWRDAALRLERENAQLRTLVRLESAAPRGVPVVGRVLMLSQAPNAGASVLDRGRRDGVNDNSVISDGRGVIGRVVQTGEHSARVLPLNDAGSALPVVSESGALRGLLVGSGGASLPEVRFTRDTEAVSPGERLLTAAGSSVPAGLPVGVVADTAGGTVRVRLYAAAPAPDGYVRITPPAGG